MSFWKRLAGRHEEKKEEREEIERARERQMRAGEEPDDSRSQAEVVEDAFSHLPPKQ